MSDQPGSYAPRHAVILAHPNPRSFNGQVADAYCKAVHACGQEAIVRDLYAQGFDPLLRDAERPREQGVALSPDVVAELEALRGTDVFVLVYPIWFGMPPAMMKGYLDRVLGSGLTARQLQSREGTPLLKGKRLVSITSSGASKAWLHQQEQVEGLRMVLGHYLRHGFGLSDFEDLHFGEVTDGLSQDFIDQNLRDVQDRARSICAAVVADHERSRSHA